MTNNDEYSTTNDNDAIYVRNVTGQFYPIQNIVLDEWRPLIGPIGLDIYNFLSRVSYREVERARVSYTILEKFLGHSRATIWTYLRLLELCELIQRDTPGSVEVIQNGKRKKKKVSNATNSYYILDPRSITSSFLDRLLIAIEKEEKIHEGFKKSFYAAIENWKPLSSYFPSARRIVRPTPTQPSLFDDEPNGDGDTPAPKDINAITKRLCHRIDVRDEQVIAELSKHEPSKLLAVIWHGKTETWIQPDRFGGYVISAFRKNNEPPAGFVYLAEKWLSMTRNERHAFAMNNWPYLKLDTAHQVANQLDVAEPTAEAILALIKSNSFSSFQNWIDIS